MVTFNPSSCIFFEMAWLTGSMLSRNCGTPNHDSTNVIVTPAPPGAEPAPPAAGAEVDAPGAAQAASATPTLLNPANFKKLRRFKCCMEILLGNYSSGITHSQNAENHII